MNAHAVALLGHVTHQLLSMHRRQAIKPFLNKEYATLCSPQGPVTEFLFGDELQSQLIGNTMASESPRLPAKGKEPYTIKINQRVLFWGDKGAGWTGPHTNKSNEKGQIVNKLTTVQVQVQDYVSFIPDLLEYVKNKVPNCQANRLSSYVEQWKLLTSDEFISRVGDRGTHRTLVNPHSG
jgi:hypothetical protein